MKNTSNQEPLYIAYAGPTLLETPLLNKGSAFTERERESFNLEGLLPTRYESIEEQVDRCYAQYSKYVAPLNKHIYLRAIQDNNETLYYRLIQEHIEEMMPIIYTPTVGDACEQFSDIYRKSRGLFISYEDRHHIDDILHNATKRNVKVIVVTDGERILGLGDQGLGGMGIPIGKLALYTACGGISPAYTMPIMLDVGTNNEKLLEDPMYMGARHKRIGQAEYDEFVELFMRACTKRWPGVMIQFEDFAQNNATPILERYRDDYCCFNDDIQGTAAVTVGTLLSACKQTGKQIRDMNVTFVGGGSAGCGIAEQLIKQMVKEGLDEATARKQIFMVDRFGLLTNNTPDMRDFQERLAHDQENLSDWQVQGEFPSLMEVVQHAKPSVLIGVSGVAGLFTEDVIRTMNQQVERPIIFPLSNPSKQVEAHPQDVIKWTDGQAIVATGSPFEPVHFDGQLYDIPQCNNSYIFPGIGLGVLASKASRISEEMLLTTSATLADCSPGAYGESNKLLPPLTEVQSVSKKIAFAVAKTAMEQGLALVISDEALQERIDKMFWHAQYRPYKRASV